MSGAGRCCQARVARRATVSMANSIAREYVTPGRSQPLSKINTRPGVGSVT